MNSTADIGWAIVRAQAGDRDALEAVLVAARAVASGIARRIALDDADDVVQEVLWIVARKLPWLDEPDAFRAWVYRIAAREATRHAARERRRWWVRPLEDIERLRVEDAPVANALVEAIPSLLERVSPPSRAVLVLHYLDEIPLEGVAAMLGIPLGTVKSRLAYGLRAIRRALAEESS